MIKYCSKHGNTEFSDTKNKARCKKCMVIAVTKRRRKIKELAINYKGGECQICGYNKYQGALEFHHIDPNEKDFNLGNKGYTRSWEKVKKELDKCILLCSNCHKEVHGGLAKLV